VPPRWPRAQSVGRSSAIGRSAKRNSIDMPDGLDSPGQFAMGIEAGAIELAPNHPPRDAAARRANQQALLFWNLRA